MPEHGRAHEPVLLREVLAALRPHPGGVYMDCTFGRGGHAVALLKHVGPEGRVIALDKDPHAVAVGRRLARTARRLSVVQGTFSGLEEWARAEGVLGEVDGVLFDLGVSSPQLEDTARGFSFRHEGRLDMRMDPGVGESAAAWLARASEDAIARVLKEYGEERFARRIARAIVGARRRGAIDTTTQLADVVGRAVPTRERDKHPATRTFQAIRIFINRELEELEAALPQAVHALAAGGRLVVISFHSLEDRLVKRFIRAHSRPPPPPRELPAALPGEPPLLRPVGKPVRPSEAEVARNPRARSAILRVAEKRA